ncbi:MAG: hypothetical protein K2W96_08510 [Gemmataceae bacterium]|nr:hypothetical protein [Gemmataceae bacterium]
MDPRGVSCDDPACPQRGKADRGNIKIHSRKEQRFRCTACKKTFAASKGAPSCRLRKDDAQLVLVVTLLAHGCPLPAFGLDERTVADWRGEAGRRCQAVRRHRPETKPPDLGHVQADELHAKRQGGRSWVAMAMAAPSRLWLGGVASPIRDMRLIERLVALARLAWLRACTTSATATAASASSRPRARSGPGGRPRWQRDGRAMPGPSANCYPSRCITVEGGATPGPQNP